MLKRQTKQLFDPIFTKNLRVAIVRTNYHVELIENLESYAKETLLEAGLQQKNVQSFIAPGSWEVALLAHQVAKSKKFDAIIAFGVIVKGETYHFEMLANEVARALMDISIKEEIPVAMEILAVYDKKHAEVRAGKDNKNKGIEAANAVLETLEEFQKLKRK